MWGVKFRVCVASGIRGFVSWMHVRPAGKNTSQHGPWPRPVLNRLYSPTITTLQHLSSVPSAARGEGLEPMG